MKIINNGINTHSCDVEFIVEENVIVPDKKDLDEEIFSEEAIIAHRVKVISYREGLSELLYCTIPFVTSRAVMSVYWISSGFVLDQLGADAFAAGPYIMSISYVTAGTVRAGLLSTAGLVGKLHASGQETVIGSAVNRGLFLGALYSVPAILVMIYSNDILNVIGVPESVTENVKAYFAGASYSIPAVSFMTVDMCFANGLKKPFISMFFGSGFAILAGFFGFPLALGWSESIPRMGTKGLGVGVSIAAWITALGLHGYYFFNEYFSKYNLFNFSSKNVRLIFYSDDENKSLNIHLGNILHSIKLCIPMSAENLAEWINFLGISIICGLISRDCLEAQQISMNIIASCNLINGGIGNTGYILVSRHLAAVRTSGKDYSFINIRTIGNATWSCGMTLAIIAGALMASIPKQIAMLYVDPNDSDNEEIFVLAQAFLITNGIGLVIDSFRMQNADLLKGFEDVIYAPLLSFLSMSMIALTAGGCLTLLLDWGADWLFITRDVGILFAATCIAYRWLRKSSSIDLATDNSLILRDSFCCDTAFSEADDMIPLKHDKISKNTPTFFYHRMDAPIEGAQRSSNQNLEPGKGTEEEDDYSSDRRTQSPR